MEIRVLCCSNVTHKSCATERMQNAAVCMMDTNSRLMSGKLLYKYFVSVLDISKERKKDLMSATRKAVHFALQLNHHKWRFLHFLFKIKTFLGPVNQS